MIEIKISDIDTAQNDTAVFKAVKLLNLDRKYEAIKVEDESGKIVAHPNKKLNIVTNFFRVNFKTQINHSLRHSSVNLEN